MSDKEYSAEMYHRGELTSNKAFVVQTQVLHSYQSEIWSRRNRCSSHSSCGCAAWLQCDDRCWTSWRLVNYITENVLRRHIQDDDKGAKTSQATVWLYNCHGSSPNLLRQHCRRVSVRGLMSPLLTERCRLLPPFGFKCFQVVGITDPGWEQTETSGLWTP